MDKAVTQVVAGGSFTGQWRDSASANILALLPQFRRLAVLTSHLNAFPLQQKQNIVDVIEHVNIDNALVPLPGTIAYSLWLDQLKFADRGTFSAWLAGFHHGQTMFQTAVRRLLTLSRHLTSNAFFRDME